MGSATSTHAYSLGVKLAPLLQLIRGRSERAERGVSSTTATGKTDTRQDRGVANLLEKEKHRYESIQTGERISLSLLRAAQRGDRALVAGHGVAKRGGRRYSGQAAGRGYG